MKHKHEWLQWWWNGTWRKCTECGQMEFTPSDDGFTIENGFDE